MTSFLHKLELDTLMNSLSPNLYSRTLYQGGGKVIFPTHKSGQNALIDSLYRSAFERNLGAKGPFLLNGRMDSGRKWPCGALGHTGPFKL